MLQQECPEALLRVLSLLTLSYRNRTGITKSLILILSQ